MKKFLSLMLVMALTDGCRMLGIGKQCYTCTTTLTATGYKSSSSEDVCGPDAVSNAMKKSGILKNGIYSSVNCVEK